MSHAPAAVVAPWRVTYCWLVLAGSLNYLFAYALPMGAVRYAVADDAVAAQAVGLGIADQLPFRAVLMSFLEAVVPALVAAAGTETRRRQVLRQALGVATTLGGVGVLVALGGAVILSGPVRLVFVAFGLATLPQLACGVMAGFLMGSLSPGRSVLVQVCQPLAIVTTLFVTVRCGADVVSAVAAALLTGPLVGMALGGWMLAQSPSARPTWSEGGGTRTKIVSAGLLSATQGGLNMAMVALLHNEFSLAGAGAVAALSGVYGLYGLIFTPFVGLTSALTIIASRSCADRDPARVRSAIAVTVGIAVVTVAAVATLAFVTRHSLYVRVGGEDAPVGQYLPLIGIAFVVFLPFDVLINLAAYSVGRGLSAFRLPLFGTVVGLVTFLVGLLGTTALADVLKAFVMAQVAWAITSVVGAWVVYVQFRRACAPADATVWSVPVNTERTRLHTTELLGDKQSSA